MRLQFLIFTFCFITIISTVGYPLFVLKWIQRSAPVFIIAPPFLSSLILFWFVLISSSSSPSSPKKHLEWLYSLNMYNLENIFLLLWKLAWLNIKLLSHTFIFSELSRYCSFVFWHKVLNLVFYCSFSILSIFCLSHHWIYFCKKGSCVLFSWVCLFSYMRCFLFAFIDEWQLVFKGMFQYFWHGIRTRKVWSLLGLQRKTNKQTRTLQMTFSCLFA